MKIVAAFKTISMAAELARTMELQKHLSTLMSHLKARKSNGPKAKTEIDLLDEEIQVLHETVSALVHQMKVMDELAGRLAVVEEWASLPWYKRMFSQPKPFVLPSSSQALEPSRLLQSVD